MSYSIVGFLSLLVHIIINKDSICYKNQVVDIPAKRERHLFFASVMTFFATDVMWGVFYELHLITALYVTTEIFFAVMMVSIFTWTRFVAAYLKSDNKFANPLIYTGIVLLTFELIALSVNLFYPILFWIDDGGGYHAGSARYITYITQIVLFTLTSIYSLFITSKTYGTVRRRHIAISFFGIVMIVFINIQVFFPLLPMYSAGYLLGICLIHSFVVEDEKEEYHNALEDLLKIELRQQQELGTAKQKIYTDPLSGAKSKQAYLDDENEINRKIKEGRVHDLGVIVFDLNDLKQTNDTRGHEMGDICIYEACMMIREFFTKSPVYRIGGDEFVIILQGEDFENRRALLTAFDRKSGENLRSGKIVVASGMAEYRPGPDKCLKDVFERADQTMYVRKRRLKKLSEKIFYGFYR